MPRVLGQINSLLVAILLFGTTSRVSAAQPIDFARDVLPIFKNHCFDCHGPDAAEGGLQLHRRADAMDGGDHGLVITAGSSAESRLIKLVSGREPDLKMPPDGDPLSSEQLAVLSAWIDAGAHWPAEADAPPTGSDHWAYIPPARHPLPSVQQTAWPRNAIDYFVLARLEQEGLSPAEETDRARLIRRVSLDLIGLPPTIEEVDAFVNDTAPDAYEKVVDRLLDSPHYGERWARMWLDLARYADTHGFEKDPQRVMWRYRDWVIQALNADLPFDQFTIEQIAGDMLPGATLDQQLASGFHRNTMINTEGGVDPEEARVATIVDRVNTTATVWLGSTLACAQCHTHKYDPFRQKEYFQLFALLNNAEEPEIEAPTPDQAAQRAAIRAQIAELETVLNTATPELAAAQAAWEPTAIAAQWQPLLDVTATASSGATFTKGDDGSLLAGGAVADKDTYLVAANTPLSGITGIRLETLTDDSLPAKGPGRCSDGNFVLSEVNVLAAPRGDAAAARMIALQNAQVDFAQEKYPAADVLDGRPESGWAIGMQMGQPHRMVLETVADVAIGAETTLLIKLEQNHGGQHTLGKFRLSVTRGPRPLSLNELPANILTILNLPAEQRTPEQQAELAAYFRGIAPALQPVRDQIAALRKSEPAVPKALVMQERGEPRVTNVHLRGNFLNPGRRVQPGTPAVLPPLTADQPANRLGLARWLVDARNPLTARVTVNRFWEQYFGQGIVPTTEDFGTQGERPNHPELLDWLATEFIANGWSMKQLHRTIVTSATYRQSSRVTPELVDLDPYNRLLARGPRQRVEAEMIRDIALTASGLLSRKIGGPSVFPPQPEGIWTQHYSGDQWVTSTGEDRYRRGLYTFWRRTSPYPAFMAFDAPSREFCAVRRGRTNTPLQALTTLNDPAFVETAVGLARRMVSQPLLDDAQRATYGFRLCVSRAPQASEVAALLQLYQSELARFQQDPAAAESLIKTAVQPTVSPNAVQPETAALAAWTVVGNVLLNLDETITKQ